MRYIFLILGTMFMSCEGERKDNLDDLVTKNADGVQEAKLEELTVEDVARLEAAASELGESYQGVLNNDIQKDYITKADTQQIVVWKLNSPHPNVKLFVYKETVSSVRKDSVNYVKVKDFKLVCETQDSCIQVNKKASVYKCVVKLSPLFSTLDSTCEYQLNIIKR